MLTPLHHQLLARQARWEPKPGLALETPAVALPSLAGGPVVPVLEDHPVWLVPPETSPAGDSSLTPDPWAGARLEGPRGELLAELPPWEPAPLAERGAAVAEELAVFEGGPVWLERPPTLVARLLGLREAAGPQRLVYVPAAPPEAWPLLVYLGADLFDGVECLAAAARGEFILPTGRYPAAPARAVEGVCGCLGCRGEGDPGQRLRVHNLIYAVAMAAQLRLALQQGRFRELVEAACHPHPELVAGLRLADTDHAESFAPHVPRVAGPPLRPTSELGFYRAEVRYWRQRLRKYRPPTQAPILLLLPCAARKPYLTSRSHQLYRRALRGCPRPWRVHELSLTSPLGLVPRELERCYPAAHYDLPVTGRWSAEEQEMARHQLKYLLRKGEYAKVISHLPWEQHRFLAELIPKATQTVPKGNNATSSEALTSLRQALVRATRGLPPITARERLQADLFGLARFQFGSKVAQAFTRGCIVKGRPDRPRLLDRAGRQLAMVDPRRGWLSLTLEGGRRLLEAGGPSILIGDFELKGDLFAGGVVEVRGEFQPGDEVVLVRGEEGVAVQLAAGRKTGRGLAEAVGVAQMASQLLEQSQRGLAVKVRHRG